MTDQLALDDLVWPDGVVRLADSGFPIQWLEGDLALEETRIALASLPDGGYAIAMWTKGTGSGPELHSIRRVAEITTIHPSQRLMTLEGGTMIQYGPSRKCGCGSRLRSFRPWATRRVIAVAKPALPWVSSEVPEDGSQLPVDV